MDDDRNLLAPDIVEAILDGRQPAEMTLEVLMSRSRWRGGIRPKRFAGRRRRGEAEPGHRWQRNSSAYFLPPAVAPPGFGLASALGTLPSDARTFFLPPAGFFASRLPLF